jgi:hypothetical protein
LSEADAKLASITFSRLSLLSWSTNLGFLTEGKSCCYIHHTFLLGFPTGWSSTTHQRDILKLWTWLVIGLIQISVIRWL